MNDIMNQILILTKNVLSEQEIQKKLQLLNYEVFCSAIDIENIQEKRIQDFSDYFQYVIISETICESEMTYLVSLFADLSINIIRKLESRIATAIKSYSENPDLGAIISNDDSTDELRECLFSLKYYEKEEIASHSIKKFTQTSSKSIPKNSDSALHMGKGISIEDKSRYIESLHRLSQTEGRILSILVNAEDNVVTRDDICRQVWGEDSSKSHLVAISNATTRIKMKFERTNLAKQAIHTFWGKGYKIDQELLGVIKENEVLNNIILKM